VSLNTAIINLFTYLLYYGVGGGGEKKIKKKRYIKKRNIDIKNKNK